MVIEHGAMPVSGWLYLRRSSCYVSDSETQKSICCVVQEANDYFDNIMERDVEKEALSTDGRMLHS